MKMIYLLSTLLLIASCTRNIENIVSYDHPTVITGTFPCRNDDIELRVIPLGSTEYICGEFMTKIDSVWSTVSAKWDFDNGVVMPQQTAYCAEYRILLW